MNTLKLYGMQGQLKRIECTQTGFVYKGQSTKSSKQSSAKVTFSAARQGFWSRKYQQGRNNYKLWLHSQALDKQVKLDAARHEFERLSSLEVSDL